MSKNAMRYERSEATVKIEVEISDPAALGFLLEDLGRAQRELQPAEPSGRKAGSATARRVEARPPLLALPYLPGDKL